jgi:Ca2+-binding EF-hand superfamily protein
MSSSSVTSAEEQLLLSRGISRDKIDEYAAAFALFSEPSGGSHKITLDSLRAMLAKFGQDFAEEDLRYMIRQFNTKADAVSVSFEDFAMNMHEKMADARFNEAFGDAFDLFDGNKSGEISKVELMTGMQMLGETLTEAEADQMIKVAKKKDDFVRAMTQSMAGVSVGGGGGGGAVAAPAPAAGAAAPSPAAAGGAGPARPAGPGAPAGPAGAPRPGAPAGPGGPPRPGGAPAAPGGPSGPPRPPGAPSAGGPARPPGAPAAPASPSAPRPPRPGG